MRVLVAVAIVVAVVMSNPGAPYGATHRTTFPAIDGASQGSVFVDRLPVTLADLTGRVRSVEPDVAVVFFDESTQSFLQYAGDPQAVRLFWLGGACSGHAKLAIQDEGGNGFLVTLDEEPEFGAILGCPALGVPRKLVIRFSTVVDPLVFRLRYRGD
jgi:hypothetical protein